jgi:hypothetical protein
VIPFREQIGIGNILKAWRITKEERNNDVFDTEVYSETSLVR